ncbi:MAG: endolytic transglycosylase MltG [Alphaproteobacteria bacterium]|nr:endolytic transglycosylase MltG [Alphaproteobacteria bacterium]
MGRILLRAGLILLILVLALGGVVAYGIDRFHQPGPLREPVRLLIPKGEGMAAVTRRLEAAGVLGNGFLFRLGVRLSGEDRALRAGEYAFPAFVSPHGVMDTLVRGEAVLRRLTVAEGLTTAAVLALIREAEGLEGAITASPPEGTLLPETYAYVWGETRDSMIARMQRAMAETLASSWAARAEGLPLDSAQEALILASIVERETALPEERPRIAAVFLNRLKRGMRLQSDPTVVYALSKEGRLDRPLTQADLETDDPYNTYRVRGFPPGPIANPGRAAIEAVMRPLETDELYFVADGSGGHVFARTLKEHRKNVRRWKRLQK